MERQVNEKSVLKFDSVSSQKDKTLRLGMALESALLMLPIETYSRYLEHVAVCRKAGLDHDFVLGVLLARGLEWIEKESARIALEVLKNGVRL